VPRNPGLKDTIPLGLGAAAHGLLLLSLTDLDSDMWVSELRRIRGKKLPLTAAGAGSRTYQPGSDTGQDGAGDAGRADCQEAIVSADGTV
jgi:hypothetical protein